MDELDKVNSKLKVTAGEIVSKEKVIASLKEKLEEKDIRLSSLLVENRELRRRVQLLGKKIQGEGGGGGRYQGFGNDSHLHIRVTFRYILSCFKLSVSSNVHIS